MGTGNSCLEIGIQAKIVYNVILSFLCSIKVRRGVFIIGFIVKFRYFEKATKNSFTLPKLQEARITIQSLTIFELIYYTNGHLRA